MPSRSRYCLFAVELCLLLALFAPCAAEASGPAHTRVTAAAQTVTFANRYGVTDPHLPLYPSTMDTSLNGIRDAGGRWVRVMFAWSDMEQSKGNWLFTGADLAVQEAQQRGIKILGILGGAPSWANGGHEPNYPPNSSHMNDWKNYIHTLCSRYKGKISAWELWNEENISQFWQPTPNSAAYVSLVSQTTPTIRADDPNATIVMGGMAGLGYGYLHECLDAGVAKYVDALAYHPYPETIGGGTDPYEYYCRLAVSLVRSLISQHTTKHLGIWLTELGWGTGPSPVTKGVDEYTQACYLLRTFINYADTDVNRVIWYNIYDGFLDPYGLLRNDMSRKPSFNYYHVFQDVFGSATSSAKGAASYSCSDPSTLEAHSFNIAGGALALAVWKSDNAADSATLTMSSPNYGRPVTVDPATGAERTTQGVSVAADGRVSVRNLAVGKRPVILKFEPTTPHIAWYLAEGTTNWEFETYISIENLNNSEVNANVTYMTDTGKVAGPTVKMPAKSQATVFPKETLGSRDFSTMVTSREGKTIAVDRTMTWTGPGAASPEAHSSIGVTSPNKTWYLPEGSSNWGFECWLLVQNPGDTKANCQVTYMIEGEAPVQVTKSVPANSRSTFNMADDIGQKDASIKVTSDVPVIPERAMYRHNRREGHESTGTTSPAHDYYLAEGTTGWGFTTYVLVQNPGDENAQVTVTYMTSAGPMPQSAFEMPPHSRRTIRVNDTVTDKDLSTHVHSDKPIIAERAMYWDNGTGEACHDSIGTQSPHSIYYLPDGQTSDGRETWTLVQNPNSTEATVEISYLTPTGAGDVVFTDTLPANSRRTYSMADKLPNSRAAIKVASKTSGHKIIVERAMYWNSRGAGTDTIGGYSD